MDLSSMLNPVDTAAAAYHAAATAAVVKTPQRAVSLAQPLVSATHPSQSPPHDILHIPRTTSLPVQPSRYDRRESSLSVSPKTMPPPAPVPFHTPSPVMSRKRSLSISDHQHTPQPMVKRRKHESPPPWALRERDGHFFEPTRIEQPRPPSVYHPQATPEDTRQTSIPPNQASAYQQPTVNPIPSDMPQNVHPPQLLPPYSRFEPSLDNMEPYNDLERQVCDFLFQHVVEVGLNFGPETKIEVEAKLGRILDWNQPNERLRLPVLTETVLAPMAEKPRFQSQMTRDHHANLNKYLNSTTQHSKRTEGREEIQYKHIRETDFFYDIPSSAIQQLDPAVFQIYQQGGARRSPRLRVTMDDETKEVTAVIVKTRLQDLEVLCPNDEFDFRISISLETAWRHPWQSFPEHLDNGVRSSRRKDRLSYRHQGFQVDLTQVTPIQNQPVPPTSKVHELEIEMDVDRLLEEGRKNLHGQPNEYTSLIHVFMNDVKVINRAARAR